MDDGKDCVPGILNGSDAVSKDLVIRVCRFYADWTPVGFRQTRRVDDGDDTDGWAG